MAKYQHTEGLCLRRIEYSNTSQVASFLTPDAGRLSFMAKGVTRAPKKGVRTGFDLLGRYELTYTARRSGSLHNLTNRWMRESFHDLRAALERMLCAYYAAELVLNFTVEGDPCPSLYESLLRAVRAFASGKALGLNVLLLELAALREHGSCPAFDACTECKRKLPARGAVLFSPQAGGPLCKACENELRGQPHARLNRTTIVSAQVLKTLAALDTHVEARPGGEAQPTMPSRTAEGFPAMSAVLRFHMRDLLGKELRMWKCFERRTVSRSLARLRRGARTGRRH